WIAASYSWRPVIRAFFLLRHLGGIDQSLSRPNCQWKAECKTSANRYPVALFFRRMENEQMATKEDILEQIAEEYLAHKGYFVQHNIKFLPRKDHPKFVSNQDSNHSDIDVIGYHPKKHGADKVIVISCKSWQGGFNPMAVIRDIEQNKKKRGRE